jgi:hypothetical protein
MDCSTMQLNGENYLIGPARLLLGLAELQNETCEFSSTYLFDDKNTRPRD